MQFSCKLKHMWLVLIVLVVFTLATKAAEPGLPYPNTSGVSDQKMGSVLFYNLYSSSVVNANAQNTDISVTNTSSTTPVFVRLFFVNSITCEPAPADICLTPNMTVSFLASDVDPGVTGYILAVAINSAGCPISFNHLIGDEYIKLASGHTANLAAEAIAALYSGDIPACRATTATLAFDGVTYNRLPRVLSLNKIASQVSDPTLLVVNRIGGDLTGLAPAIGPVSGIIFDDAENAFSFSFLGSCQVADMLSAFIPSLPLAWPTGWMKFSATSDFGLFGAAIRFNPAMGVPAFKGGHNLHKLTLSDSVSLTVPLFITNPPFTIICPPDVIAVTAKPGERNVTVTYPTPAALGSSTGRTVVCAPPSDSTFSVGSTTVTCTATFSGGVTATCSFKVTIFHVCLDDDRSGDALLFNSFTGDYQFTSCNGA